MRAGVTAAVPDWADALRRSESLPADYLSAVAGVIAPLARRFAALRDAAGRPVVIGINGGQGSGKSTLSLFAASWMRRELGLRAAILSLDDLYLTRAEREALARREHPLLVTRGVPGTHDVSLGLRLLDELAAPGDARRVALPGFDKAIDDRRDRADWPVVDAPVDVVLFEGWCIGARPQDEAALMAPVNALEAGEDPDGRWRRYVNDRLDGAYRELFGRLDQLVMLRVPSFDKVLEWRRLQEHKLRRRIADRPGQGGQGQSDSELTRFVQHYERLTRHMLERMPAYADSVVSVDDCHRMVQVVHGRSN